MKNEEVETRHRIHVLNSEITKRQAKLMRIEDYSKSIQALVPMVELAIKLSSRADLDNGEDKNAWRTILADILTIREEVAETYSGLADIAQEMSEEVNKLKKEVEC